MADYVNNFGKAHLMGRATQVNLLTASQVRLLLSLQLSSTDLDAATTKDIEFISGVTVLGEQANANGGANYARQTLGTTAIFVNLTTDTPASTARFDAADTTIVNYTADGGANANKVGGALVFAEGGATEGTRPMLWWYEFADVPVVAVTFTIQWAAEGLFKIT